MQMIGNNSTSETDLVKLSSQLKDRNIENDNLKIELLNSNGDVLRLSNVCQNFENSNQELLERISFLEKKVKNMIESQKHENEIKNNLETKINSIAMQNEMEKKNTLAKELEYLKKKHSMLFDDFDELK